MLGRCLVVTALIALPAGPAGAQTGDPDSSTVRWGSIGITPVIAIRDIGRDTNVFNEHDNPKSDFTMTLAPRADVVFAPRGLKLTYSGGTEYVYYKTYVSERSVNRSDTIRADFLLGRIQPYVLASRLQTSARLNTEVDARARHTDRALGGGLTIKLGTRTAVGAAWRKTRVRFDEGETFRGQDLATRLDAQVETLDVSTALQLTAFTELSVVVSQDRQRFDRSPERDADSYRITPTFSFSPDAVVRGSVAVGYRKFTPRAPQHLPGFSGLIAVANVGTTLFTRNRVALTVARDLRYSYEQATPYYLATGGTVTVTTELVGPFDLRTTATRQLLAYRADATIAGGTDPGDDTFTSAGGGFGYRVREHLRLGINVEWSKRDSDLSVDRTYRGRRVFASVTWGTE